MQKTTHWYRNVEIEVSYDTHISHFGDYAIYRKYEKKTTSDTQYKAFIFTDRSIYRPGQTVYFKGIITKTQLKNTTVLEGETVTGALYNVNGEKLQELNLTTNAFGSINGEFILPNSELTGQFQLRLSSKKIGTFYSYFSVEDYKRPKFKPEFLPITQTIKVNDSVTINGFATAFAGSSISDAKVVYRVRRLVQFPAWYYWKRPYYKSKAQEIAFGETQTNSKGEFTINFKAQPDEGVSKENLPIFRYEVTADVTDINGETRSATTVVNVGYHSMTATIKAPEFIDNSKKKTEITILAQNLNGEKVQAKGHLKIYKLNAPNSVFRPRLWPSPDYQSISENEFKTLFPHEPYKNEDLLRNWSKGKLVFSTDFDTEKNTTVDLKRIHKWDLGKYLIVLQSEDPFGQALKDEVFTTLGNPEANSIADKQLFTAQLDKLSYTVNSTATLTLGSAAENINVTVEIEKDNTIIETHLVQLNNSVKRIDIPVLESDLGGFVVHCSFAAYNYFQTKSYKIDVPLSLIRTYY